MRKACQRCGCRGPAQWALIPCNDCRKYRSSFEAAQRRIAQVIRDTFRKGVRDADSSNNRT